MFSIYLVSRFTRVFESTINIMIRAKRKAGRTTKKLLTLTLTCTPCFSWREVRRLRIITLRKLSPWLSVLGCKHAESTKITFNRQGCGRNSELIHTLQIQVAEWVSHDVTMHFVNIYSPPQSTKRHSRFTRTYLTHPKMCQGGMRVNLARLTVPL